jgi:hypothetical protein
MSSSATRQPSARKRFAVASPMPRAAPVTRATFCGAAVMQGPSLSGYFARSLSRALARMQGVCFADVSRSKGPVS